MAGKNEEILYQADVMGISGDQPRSGSTGGLYQFYKCALSGK